MSNDRTRRRILAAIEAHGDMSRADIERALRIEYGVAVRHLVALERFGHIRFDATHQTYSLSERAAMRRKKNSPTAGFTSNSVDRVVLPGSGGTISMERERERIIRDMEGDGGLLLYIVRDEVSVYERAQAALALKWDVPTEVFDVPVYRRLAAIEDALKAWEADLHEFGCDFCGTRRRPTSGYVARGYLEESMAPFSQKKDGRWACRWCADFLAGHTEDELRRAVFNAVAGCMGMGGVFGKTAAAAVPFASEVATERGVVPWQHIGADQRAAIRIAAQQHVHPSRFAKTEGARDRIALPGIVPPPAPPAVPAHFLPTRATREQLDLAPQEPGKEQLALHEMERAKKDHKKDVAAAERRHDKERADFLRDNPRPGLSSREPVPWPAADKWGQLLEKQADELAAIDMKHFPREPRSRWLSPTAAVETAGAARRRY